MGDVFENEYTRLDGAPAPSSGSQPTPFQWSIMDGGEAWTGNAAIIGKLSDPPIIDRLLREGEVASVVGGAKSCKTWFALALGVAVSQGREFLGFKTYRRKVLHLDYELKQGTFRKRMCMVADERPDLFTYQLLRGAPELPGVEDIDEVVRDRDVGLVVIDSLYRSGWLSEENSNDSTGAELSALQRMAASTGAAILVVDHTAKGGGEGRTAVDASRGASAKGGFFDDIYVLRPTDQGPDPEGNYVILDPVTRDWPKLKELPLIEFAWGETNLTIEAAGEVAAGATNSDGAVILGFLAEQEKPVGVAFVAAQVGLTEKRVRTSLKSLEAKGKVKASVDPAHKQRQLFRLPDIGD